MYVLIQSWSVMYVLILIFVIFHQYIETIKSTESREKRPTLARSGLNDLTYFGLSLHYHMGIFFMRKVWMLG
jgi:hypothetical protein